MRLRLALLAAALLLIVPVASAGAPQVSGRAYLVQNGVTGEVLAQRADRERVPIASITKLMTVLVALQHASLDDVVTVSRRAAAVGESSIYLQKGDRLTVGELVEAALIQSANDAAVALAEHVGGSQAAFVAMMNAEAQRLGLRDTHFANPDGLDETDHYSSAHDVTRLARIAMKNRVIRGIVARRTAEISGGRTLTTWNDLLGTYPGVFGVKTGHTSAAGWSEVAAARSHGVTVYATLLGSPSRDTRNADLAELLTWGLTRYRTIHPIVTGRVYATAKAPYGRHALTLVASTRSTRIVRVGRPLLERVVAPTVVSLPVEKGQPLGQVQVLAGRKVIASSPLVASRSIARPGFLGRAGWYTTRTLHHVGSWFS
ncbi:MAG TPA: D-alanyl-D-alanine carboxypeptidase family protein [Gaiellaceae bacterium]|nr:D-alanyl-D-alanine carboxypeptidase family protein [Gaiellaceae bacterium]